VSKAIRVLLVEDHQHVRWGLEKLIGGEWPRMSVSGAASNVADALVALGRGGFDVVLLDVFLGDEESLAPLAPAIGRSGAALLVHTASRDPEIHRLAEACGAHAVVLKDQPADVLLHEIERAHRARGEGCR
jgi:DNA-binding NarL/FixJ family response regulator